MGKGPLARLLDVRNDYCRPHGQAQSCYSRDLFATRQTTEEYQPLALMASPIAQTHRANLFSRLIRQSLQVRLIALLLVVALPPVTLSIWFAHHEYAHLRQATEDDARILAAHILESLDRLFFERYGDTQLMTQIPAVRGMEAERLTAIAEGLVTTYSPYYSLVVVADRNGIIRAVNSIDGKRQPISSQQLVGQSVRGQPWFEQALMNQGVSIFDLQADSLVQQVYGSEAQRTVTFASRIQGPAVRGKEGTTVGVWSSRMSEPTIAQLLQPVERSVETGDAVRFALFAKDGRRIGAAHEQNWQASLDVMPQPLVLLSSSGFGAYRGLGWTIGVFPSDVSGMARTPFSIPVSLAIMVSLLLGLLFLLQQTRKHLLQPLRALAVAAQQIEQGQVAAIPQDTNRVDTIGVLQGRLARMVGAIQTHESEARSTSAALKKQADALKALVQQIREISTESGDLRRFLQCLTESACSLVNARYGALARFDEGGTNVTEFIAVGMDEEAQAAIGKFPEGRGLLGTLAHSEEPLRLKDLTAHPSSVGFPPHHPPMHSFLGVAIKTHGCFFGHLYLTERQAGDEFTDVDEQILVAFASQAGVLIENALLLQSLRETDVALRASNQELENFVYAVSHDLQTPLRAVHGFADLLVDQANDRLSEQEQHYLGRIQAGAKRMERLIHDLLEYSRIDRMSAAFTWVSMGDLFEQVRHDLQEVIHSSGATLQLNDPLPILWADPARLRQIWTNLLANAIKYVAPGVVPQITVSCREEQDHVVCTIRDNGIGIAPEFHARIFKLFHRLHPSGVYAGTGVGLASVKRGVEFHRGRIWVESALGQGSAFQFTIPKPSPSSSRRMPAATATEPSPLTA
ncbi:MAG: ATP-binding protein [Nitrospirae bacterium]|nr:ATP-binding protein [Nitrospirota bacterium]